MTDTPGKDSTPNQRPEEGNAPGLVSDHDVVGESIRRRYASSPGLIDLAAPRKLINRFYEFGRQRVPLLNRVLARWAVGTGNRISYSPLPLSWRLYRPYESELSAGYEPPTLTGQTSRSGPVPALQPRQLSPGAAGRGDRTAPQLKGDERERPFADVGGHAVTPASEQRSSGTTSEDPVRVPPAPDSGWREELPGSDRQSQGTSVLTRDSSLLPRASLSGRPVPGSPLQPDPLKPSGKSRPGPELELAHRPVEPQVTSRDPAPGAGITAAPGSVSTILAATRIAPETPPGGPLTPAGSTLATGLFRRATSWLKSYTAEGFPAIHLLRQAPGIARTEPASPPALSRTQPGEGWISYPLFRYPAGSSPWGSPGARHFSALPAGPRTGSHVEIHRSVKAQEPPPPGSPFREPPQSDERRIRTAGSVSSAADANRSGAMMADGVATSLTPVFGLGQTWIGLSRIGSGKGSIPFPLFRYPAGSSPGGRPGARPFFALPSALPTISRAAIYRSANAPEAQPRPGSPFPEPLQSDKGTANTPDPAFHPITVKGITQSPLSGPELGVLQTTPRTLSRIGSKEGSIPLPLLVPDAGSSAWGGHGAADSPSIPQVPVKTSRRDILRSTHAEPPHPRQGPSAGTDEVQNSVESSPGERPSSLPMLQAQPQRQPGPSSQVDQSSPRDPVSVDAPGTNRPLAPAGLGAGFVPMVHRSLKRARPGSPENSDRIIGRTAFSLGATIASSMLFPLTGPGSRGRTARPGRQPTSATDLAPVRRAIDPIVNSAIRPMLSPSRTVYDSEDGRGDAARLPVAGHSEWSAAPRAPILSRFGAPLKNAGFGSADAGRVLTTAAVESNQVPSDQPFPARLASTVVSYAEAPRAQEGQPPVFTGLGSVTRIARTTLSFPFHRAAEVTALPWSKTGASALVESQSSIVNRQSSIKIRTMLPSVPTQAAGHLSSVDLHRMAPVRSLSTAAEGPMVPSSGGHVFASRASRIAPAPGLSVSPASGVPASLISLRAPEALGDPGEAPLRYSEELPLAPAVQRRAGNGGGDQGVHAESPGVPAGPGDLAQRAISLPGTEGGADAQVTTPVPPAPTPAGVDIEELFDRVVRRLVREVAIERERRGFTPWL